MGLRIRHRARIGTAALGLTFAGILVLSGTGALRAQSPPLVRVGTSNSEGASIIFFAQEMGFFKKAGITVDIQAGIHGAAGASAVLSGALDIGVSDVLTVAQAHAKHLPLLLIAPAGLYSPKSRSTALMVDKSSSIASGSDLNGKIVAVDGLNNDTQVAAKGWIDAHGGNSESTRFVELPFSEMAAALQRHTVDAAVIAEPAVTLAKASARIIGYPDDSIASVFLMNGWFANSAWIAKNQETVKRFAGALHEAARWANHNQTLSAPILVAHTGITANLVANMTRLTYGETLDPALVQPQIDAAAKYGALRGTFSASEIIYDSGRSP